MRKRPWQKSTDRTKNSPLYPISHSINESNQWSFDPETGLIKWLYSTGKGNDPEAPEKELCWYIQSTRRFTPLKLKTCRATDPEQQFIYDNGMIKIKSSEKFTSCIQVNPYGVDKYDIVVLDDENELNPRDMRPRVLFGPCPLTTFGEIQVHDEL